MLRAIGRLLQWIGLAMPLLAVFLQLPLAISLGQMLVMALGGLAAFWLGRIVEGYASAK
jgi:hypothetical protein